MSARDERMKIANAFLAVMAGCGRRFFHHDGRVAAFILMPSLSGRLLRLVDAYSKRPVVISKGGPWHGFTNGGTMRSLIEALAAFIKSGKPLSRGYLYWHPNYCNGDLWGYGADMEKVRTAAVELGLRSPEAGEKGEASE